MEGVACRLGQQCQRGSNVGFKMDTLNERIRFFPLSTRKEEKITIRTGIRTRK